VFREALAGKRAQSADVRHARRFELRYKLVSNALDAPPVRKSDPSFAVQQCKSENI
jgi:hypothetical protein